MLALLQYNNRTFLIDAFKAKANHIESKTILLGMRDHRSKRAHAQISAFKSSTCVIQIIHLKFYGLKIIVLYVSFPLTENQLSFNEFYSVCGTYHVFLIIRQNN